jgi:hypothetical protein
MAIVHGWNGTLEIDTAPGAGTRMSIVLPAVEGQSSSAPEGRAAWKSSRVPGFQPHMYSVAERRTRAASGRPWRLSIGWSLHLIERDPDRERGHPDFRQ